jgi:hypothetical protein
MEKDEIVVLAEEAIDEYFASIDDTVDEIMESIIDKYGLDDDDLNEEDKKALKERIMRGVLKLDVENIKPGNNN